MRNVFRKFDRGGKGYLDRRDIEKLARWLHPQVTSADVAWFQSQLDEGEGAVYEADLQAAIKVHTAHAPRPTRISTGGGRTHTIRRAYSQRARRRACPLQERRTELRLNFISRFWP